MKEADSFLDPEEAFMLLALVQAGESACRGETPIGAVVVNDHGLPLVQDGNRTLANNDPTGHAEILVLRGAARRFGDFRLTGFQLFVTMEPCPMCQEATRQARIAKVHYATPRLGAKSALPENHHQQQERYAHVAGALVRDFFKNVRNK